MFLLLLALVAAVAVPAGLVAALLLCASPIMLRRRRPSPQAATATPSAASGRRFVQKAACVAVVVVGGDFARSPRMQYHATSLCESEMFTAVRCVGLDEGNRLSERLVSQRRAVFDLIPKIDVPGTIQRSWLLRTIYRVAAFVFFFTRCLWRATAPVASLDDRTDTRVVMLLQTPPAVPFLILAHAVAFARRRLVFPPQQRCDVRIVVDFHNFGYTLLEVDRRPKPLVMLYRLLEQFYGVGDAHFTVSTAMQRRLEGTDKVVASPWLRVPAASVTVLRDCAPSFFAPTADRDAALRRLRETEQELFVPEWFVASRRSSNSTGDKSNNEVQQRRRTLALVSSTSWTADDDYALVVEALRQLQISYSSSTASSSPSPDGLSIWLLVTGKGATRPVFEQQVRDAGFQLNGSGGKGGPRNHGAIDITVSTHYFQSFQSYATCLGLFDAGLCLHRSSSGLDLPMKCVDMFGARLPVMALAYSALPELVGPTTGWCFNDAPELAAVMDELLSDDREGVAARLEALRVAIANQHSDTWDQGWRQHALPAIAQQLVK